MLSRLVVIVMLVLFPLQWGVAQTHDAGDEAQSVALSAVAHGTSYAATPEHSREPDGICDFHQLAQASALWMAEDMFAAFPRLPQGRAALHPAARIASGLQADIERPQWAHHGSFRGGPLA